MKFNEIIVLLLIYPIFYALLAFFDALELIYDPLSRISMIIGVSVGYFVYTLRKKNSKQSPFVKWINSYNRAKVGKEDYYYTYTHNEHSDRTYIETFVDDVYNYDFSLKFEGSVDRFFKFIGLSKECQSGDTKFDKTIYIISDDPKFCSFLQENESLRNKIYSLFWSGYKDDFMLKSMKCFDGKILITSEHISSELNTGQISHYTLKIAELMLDIRKYLSQKTTFTEHIYREPTGVISQVFTILLIGFLVNGGIVFVTDYWIVPLTPKLVDPYSILILSMQITTIVVSFLIVSIFLLLRNSSRLSPTFFQTATIGVMGIWMSAIVEIIDINSQLDSSMTTMYETQIVNKDSDYHRRGKTTYQVYLEKWGNNTERLDLDVPNELYNRVEIGDRVRVYQRNGYLGYLWLEKIELLSQKNNH